MTRDYVGRFAPSPTGPLHFGSLVAAAASFVDARAAGGRWLVRMEDVDTPRIQPGAADAILRALDDFGLYWDGPVLYQSDRIAAYDAALETLRSGGAAYPCGCSRKEIADARYTGICRAGLRGRHPRAWRVRTGPEVIRFVDRLQGEQQQVVEEYCGDFIALRADGLFAYQLAVVVDDAFQGITDIVRGADLLDSTARQIHLQRLLGYPTPSYLHTPVVVNNDGQKLSKQTLAPGIDSSDALRLIRDALTFLGHTPPKELGAVDELWQWAIGNWSVERIPQTLSQMTS